MQAERRVDQHERPDSLRREHDALHGRARAERMADERHARAIESRQQVSEAPPLGRRGVVVCRGPLGEAERGHVHRHGAVAAIGQPSHRLAPDLAPGARAVHENDDVPVGWTRLLDVELDVVRAHEVTGERRERLAETGFPEARGGDREDGGEHRNGDEERQAPQRKPR